MEKRYIIAIKENAESLIDEWTQNVNNSSEHYRDIPLAETREKISDHFWGLVEIFEENNYDKLKDFLSQLAEVRTSMGFNLKETLLAFQIGQSVLLRFFDKLRGHETAFCFNCREITDGFSQTQFLYSQIFLDYDFKKKVQSYEEKIREKDLRLSSLTEGTADAVIILDENLIIRSWNRGAEEMYQYTSDEILGKELLLLVPDENTRKGEIEKLVSIVNKKGYIKNYQSQRIRKNGTILTIDITTTKLSDSENRIIGYSSIHRDLTEKILLEQEMRSQEQYLSTIVDNSVDAIIGLDLNNDIVSWNKGAEDIFGYKSEEIIDKNIEILLPDESIKAGELNYLNEQINKEGFIKNHECSRITKSGKRIITSMTRSPIRDKNGKVIGCSAILRDITEYKKLKSQMSHSEKLSVVGQLAAGIAHEVGNPLTSISSLIQVLSRKTDDAELNRDLKLIKKQTDRITKLIRDLVTFSQPTDSNIKLTDINNLVKEAVTIIQYDRRAKGTAIDITLDNKLTLLELPEDQVLQVFINILLNAVDALPPNNGSISIRSMTKNGKIYIYFEDNGHGIPEANIDKIFDPFFTTKSVGKGTGLGLWVSYSIIESFDGKISVKSKENKGSIFTVEIPLMR